MIPVLLFGIPLVSGLAGFFLKKEDSAKNWALLASILTLLVSISGLTIYNGTVHLAFHASWFPAMGSNFDLALDSMGQLLCFLTAITFPVIFVACWNRSFANARSFFGLMLLSQAGLMGVFLAMDYLLFYFFWELALVPVYFLCSRWGGEKRIAVTFKFFIYTFVGSMLMLVGIIYLYTQTPDGSFSASAFYALKLPPSTQSWLFWLFFVAFAIKMPIFPLHTWQPDTYEQSPTAVTMVLSAVMVKMGVFALIRWLIPILPIASWAWQDTLTTFAIVGMLYASLLAIQQDDLKRLVAYSSIAHVGLMCVAIFSGTESGLQGAVIQMFNHGINILGLWVVIEIIERRFGTRKMSELGGLARKAPALAILLVIVALANIALPLTNAFVGEFLMLNGLFNSGITQFSQMYTILAGITIILGAVYMLRMIQKVFFGEASVYTAGATDIDLHEKIILSVLVVMIFLTGVFPQPMLDATNGFVKQVMNQMYFQ
jgi:NADH-quinone oxidoreductase subunit M